MTDLFYVTQLPGRRRLAVNVYEIVGIEECTDDSDPPVKIIRFYMRNGAAFNIQDPGRKVLDNIQNKLRGYGGNEEDVHAGE